ncbi:metalloregulator ArsR/SmtB family transcription factor [Microcella daejeonensis]|uniref:Metalloregulator ArsR/SmtB family transcription factor n=1 Tax=Microcella daejeonensis TaxID=2994971 RepID=A0A9E8MIX9_9MICO|nr:metalloregulator ArsR/SmtB family transcription factor [Microcella daejeonensis]WAB80399.1 metalloregulator ArsR/SmtB family transcription factor [Microcella daejeonensis]
MSTAVAPAAACAPTTAAPPLDAEAAQALARTLKAVADPARLRLLSIVAASTDGAVCVCDLTDPVGLSQPTVSHHLRVLVEAGLLAREKRGSWAYFSVVPGAVNALGALLGAAVGGRALPADSDSRRRTASPAPDGARA